MKKEIEIIINTSELGAGTRGASLGPKAIMAASRERGSNLFSKHPPVKIETANHLLDSPNTFRWAKRIDGISSVFETLQQTLNKAFKANKFPVLIAGDHSSAGGTIAGIKNTYPNSRLGVIWIDAHADLHSPYTTPSGNVHGMPLATALAEDNRQCERRLPDEQTITLWNRLKESGGIAPKILPEDLVFIAVRDTEAEENAIMDRLKIRNFKVEEVRQKGCYAVADEILQLLKNCELIYVSFDVDSMDPELTSYGTGTPVPNGLSPDEAMELLLRFASEPKTVCMELVEVNPCLDEKKNKMAETASQLLEAITIQRS